MSCCRRAEIIYVTVSVIADYNDVYLEQGLETPMLMEYPIKNKTVTDITATVKQHQDIISVMLAAHSLTGCDTVCSLHSLELGNDQC